ncbi:hypothetical protein DUI87_31733 [Hirundo rustica rustica]|uniref:Integrase zinc-binding domain-containing protein n=1 Tax=Hirundo rustica rustica TaxID=333673 RepID=A0A3M0IT38_HIRRU|nr:hypothetical protein DUI87_31733 [Hirundo rustica rustica]
MEQGIRCLRELAVLEIIFSEDERFPKSPDDVQCTSQMWLRFAQLGPEMCSRYLATLRWREGENKDIAARVEKLTVKVRHMDAHVSKSQANEEHHNNEEVDKAAKVEVSQVDLDWQHKGEVFLARGVHDASGHQGRDATYRWVRDRGVDLTMDKISQVIHNCETCTAIKQAKRG